ncbi:MAG TPA: polysaccharide deacetylase family protein [Vicinamibacteria bacterium]|jgi:peptidoglycan/xylan/chitin deacetylase (PgdA/CDA1 family)|nr:polysaccharide deacetylase family protein [Vicinamibacteria bacterium]
MRPPRAAILMYHRVSETGAEPEEGDYALPSALFEAQIRLLAAEGRAVVPLVSLAQGPYPDGAVVLTFDDGCDTDAMIAAPLLRTLGFPAAFFVNPARVGQAGRLSWDQLRGLAADGFAIGSHGLDHTLLDHVSAPELQRQLVDSKQRLQECLRQPVDALSLPGGRGGRRAWRMANAAGYRWVLGSRPGLVRGAAGAGILPRFPLRRAHGLAGFSAAVGQRPSFLLRQLLRHQATHVTRALLSARAYDSLRRLWLARFHPTGRA